MVNPPLRAFIARPRGIEVTPIEALLRSLGVVADDPTMRVSAAQPVYDAVLNAIRTSDFAIVVYESPSAWLNYELGACDALNKPVLLISLSQGVLPQGLRRYMQVRVDIDNPETFEGTITRFVEQVREGLSPRRSLRKYTSKRSRHPEVDESLSQIRNLREHFSAIALENAVRRLLEATAGFVESHSAPGDTGADLALWNEASDSVLPQPIFVEIKGGRLSSSRIAEAERRLEETVRKGGAVAGLLLYLDTSGRRYSDFESRTTNVWRSDIEDFAEQLTRDSLASVLRRLRAPSADA
jgi:hypothetical protein